jgi:hypothetical protein
VRYEPIFNFTQSSFSRIVHFMPVSHTNTHTYTHTHVHTHTHTRTHAHTHTRTHAHTHTRTQ